MSSLQTLAAAAGNVSSGPQYAVITGTNISGGTTAIYARRFTSGVGWGEAYTSPADATNTVLCLESAFNTRVFAMSSAVPYLKMYEWDFDNGFGSVTTLDVGTVIPKGMCKNSDDSALFFSTSTAYPSAWFISESGLGTKWNNPGTGASAAQQCGVSANDQYFTAWSSGTSLPRIFAWSLATPGTFGARYTNSTTNDYCTTSYCAMPTSPDSTGFIAGVRTSSSALPVAYLFRRGATGGFVSIASCPTTTRICSTACWVDDLNVILGLRSSPFILYYAVTSTRTWGASKVTVTTLPTRAVYQIIMGADRDVVFVVGGSTVANQCNVQAYVWDDVNLVFGAKYADFTHVGASLNYAVVAMRNPNF